MVALLLLLLLQQSSRWPTEKEACRRSHSLAPMHCRPTPCTDNATMPQRRRIALSLPFPLAPSLSARCALYSCGARACSLCYVTIAAACRSAHTQRHASYLRFCVRPLSRRMCLLPATYCGTGRRLLWLLLWLCSPCSALYAQERRLRRDAEWTTSDGVAIVTR